MRSPSIITKKHFHTHQIPSLFSINPLVILLDSFIYDYSSPLLHTHHSLHHVMFYWQSAFVWYREKEILHFMHKSARDMKPLWSVCWTMAQRLIKKMYMSSLLFHVSLIYCHCPSPSPNTDKTYKIFLLQYFLFVCLFPSMPSYTFPLLFLCFSRPKVRHRWPLL